MIVSVDVREFRTVEDVQLDLGPVTALVGEHGSGKSNLLAAIWLLLNDELPGKSSLTLDDGPRPRGMFLPAAERDGEAIVETVRGWLHRGWRDAVVLIEEPELFLRPHAQRTLYRLLRELAAGGNQVLYSTHESTFLNVARLEEIVFIDRPGRATQVRRPRAVPPRDEFRALSEFDAERSELLLARTAVLVEGRTEKLVFPYFFRALGYEVDDEGISIVECGGKPNIPVIAEVCNLVGLPYLVVHDRDAPAGRRPNQSERFLNDAIRQVAGPARVVELARDFEAVTKLHGHRHKPEHALEWIAVTGGLDVPPTLADVVRRAVALARGDAS